ncbi:chemotaxis protein CheW [Paraburkholderia caballeronis]|uniref:Purine-binding chemotaxis protein CheW n=1 Tax=Paraburkholderia caballeronis TaxID=416943 RepID=A0A1H7M472_9BURK|nr:chemotaxis protein CheW [Paraburkholderia caballeronis]PXW28711.1 purine-binding chemotaxis protein CheW [Paraburkholderia caballeronis]PXX04077.1 purine-binding chemotaxis protein CheW [Paraburkholderia caballeronis]RAK04821.1 purine-binding chemotaxis protein CheW [Paraburkholderia caballeronis]SED63170.1 purine-binding chemotaxis protein CheW [Paraburkholderia caballeronis]SEL05768.1 purine-binding chemotaxis protein CheW [Paraburkholderia caballeronis]
MNPDPDQPPSPLAALLANPDDAKLLHRRALDLARPGASASPQRTEPYLHFRLGAQQSYGIAHALVDEVLAVEDIALVPCAPPAFSGIINRRGQMLPVLDLARLFGLDPANRPRGANHSVVVISAAGLTLGLNVEPPIDIAVYPSDALGPPPHGRLPTAYVSGLIQGQVTLLDMERIVTDLCSEGRHA